LGWGRLGEDGHGGSERASVSGLAPCHARSLLARATSEPGAGRTTASAAPQALQGGAQLRGGQRAH
jgi:hypothetical protein